MTISGFSIQCRYNSVLSVSVEYIYMSFIRIVGIIINIYDPFSEMGPV
jgi:hypothetical protein